MRRTRKKQLSPGAWAPMVKSFRVAGPKALERQISTRTQTRYDEGTILWGADDSFPLRLAKTVEDSPAATSCLGTRAKFIKGARFSDPDLMKLKINKKGQTLWQLHCDLVSTLVLFEGFSACFKYNEAAKIVSSYCMDFESLRFMKPEDDLDTDIKFIKYNPYFGTGEYKQEYSKTYPLYDPKALVDQLVSMKKDFPGQVYYFGKTKPTHRFYPNPDYWSAENWMYVDNKIQEAHAENVDNGFFQSCEMVVVGDPNRPSENPKYKEEYTDANGNKQIRSTKTQGEEFNDQMSETFSGVSKMGTVLTRWVKNKEEAAAAQINEFPSNANGELFLALQDLTTKNITIATRVPGILANISEGVSLGSDGKEMQKAIELMQSNTSEDRELMESFYNEVLLPNMAPELIGNLAGRQVEIVSYNPITVPVEVDDKFWDIMSAKEKREFIKSNIPSIQLEELSDESAATERTLIEVIGVGGSQAMLSILEQYGSGTLSDIQTKNILQILFGLSEVDASRMIQKSAQQVQQEISQTQQPETNELLRNLTGRQMQGIQRTVRQFNKGELTYEQAKTMLQSAFALTDEQVDIFLTNENEQTNPLIVSK